MEVLMYFFFITTEEFKHLNFKKDIDLDVNDKNSFTDC